MTSMNSRKKKRPINDHYHFKFLVCCWGENMSIQDCLGLDTPKALSERLGPAVMLAGDWLLRVEGGCLSHN